MHSNGPRIPVAATLAGAGEPSQQLCDCLPEPSLVFDLASQAVLACNNAAVTRYGFSREEFLKMKVLELFEGEGSAPFGAELARQGSGHHPSGPWRHCRKHGPPLDVELTWKHLDLDGRKVALLLSHDITQRLRSEKRAAVLASLGQSLSSARTPRQAAESIVAAADELFGWDACLFDLYSPNLNESIPVLALDTVGGKRMPVELKGSVLGPIGQAAIQHGPQLVLRSNVESFPPGARPFGDTSRPSASIMTVPVRQSGRTLAMLSIQSYSPNAYRQADLRLFQALADHCVGALDRLRAEAEITRLNSELRGHLEELQTLFDVAPVGIAVAHDPECHTLTLNAACARLFGVDAGKFLVTNPLPFRATRGGKVLHPEELPMRQAARDRVVLTSQELDIAAENGPALTCYVSASPLFDDNGQVRGSLGIFVDLTERKNAEQEIRRLNAELERRVRDRTMQLEAINKELEAFSYSVSHDLRAPLRSIRGFSEVLLERYQDALDERGREFLSRACESCVQMDRLIEDLLKLSRVGRSELSWQEIDLSAMAESILRELHSGDTSRNVRIRITPGLRACGDERLLRVALDNLLRNAWKFTGNQPETVIEFGATDGQERAFFVRDNGAGFDMAYASKLFGVFQRLHSASEYPGTGIGLATVQRIIGRHGGRAWAEGSVNHGATFYFTLSNDVEP